MFEMLRSDTEVLLLHITMLFGLLCHVIMMK
jgi:hypothetical protein